MLSTGHPEGMSNGTADATKFKELEGALRESEESLATVWTELSRVEADLREQHNPWATVRSHISVCRYWTVITC